MDLRARVMPCAACNHSAIAAAERQRPALIPAWSSACTESRPTGLSQPGGLSRSNNPANPPAVNLSNQSCRVERARPNRTAKSSKVCWPSAASSAKRSRSLARASVTLCNRCANLVRCAGVSDNCVRFRPMLPSISPFSTSINGLQRQCPPPADVRGPLRFGNRRAAQLLPTWAG